MFLKTSLSDSAEVGREDLLDEVDPEGLSREVVEVYLLLVLVLLGISAHTLTSRLGVDNSFAFKNHNINMRRETINKE